MRTLFLFVVVSLVAAGAIVIMRRGSMHGLNRRIPHPMCLFLDVTLLGVVVAVRRALGDAYRTYRQHT